MYTKYMKMAGTVPLCAASILVLLSQCVHAAPPRDFLMPPLQFDIYNIKTPQLIGIIAGCCVFTITIAVVLYLLLASGTLQRALTELTTDAIASGKGAINSQQQSQGPPIAPYDHQPELYDHLLDARKALSPELKVPPLRGQLVHIQSLDHQLHIHILHEACDGRALYHESAYNAERLWGWRDLFDADDEGINDQEPPPTLPWHSPDALRQFLQREERERGAQHVVIVDNTYAKPIGLLSLNHNSPINLTINIGTPRLMLLFCFLNPIFWFN